MKSSVSVLFACFFNMQLSMYGMNQSISTISDKKKSNVTYATIGDKKWAIVKQFFIGKRDNNSDLYNIPKNIIYYIFKFVEFKNECHIESIEDDCDSSKLYNIRFDVLIHGEAKDKARSIFTTNMNCFYGCGLAYNKRLGCHAAALISIQSKDDNSLPRDKVQECVDIINKAGL